MQALSSTEKCRVCNSTGARNHFGGVCCKACSSFFRRYVNSVNLQSICECRKSKPEKTSFLCRHCRMERCRAAGMNKCRVQLPKKMTVQSRDLDRILKLKNAFDSSNYGRKDSKLFSEDPHLATLRRMTSGWKEDSEKVWKIYVKGFPELLNLSNSDANGLLCNFYIKWVGFSSAIKVMKLRKDFRFFSLPPPIDTIHQAHVPSLERFFMPFWDYFSLFVLKPILDLKLDNIEVFAVMALLFMDARYPNLSESAVNLCCNIEKTVRLQFTRYYYESGTPIERLMEVLNIPLIMEKFDQKVHDKVILCTAYGITIDEACLQFLRASKF